MSNDNAGIIKRSRLVGKFEKYVESDSFARLKTFLIEKKNRSRLTICRDFGLDELIHYRDNDTFYNI